MEQDLIRERYDLSMARIRDFLTEETVPEVYRDYFKKVTELIIQCGEVLKAKEDGSLDKMTLEEGRALNQKLYADVLPGAYETSYANPASRQISTITTPSARNATERGFQKHRSGAQKSG